MGRLLALSPSIKARYRTHADKSGVYDTPELNPLLDLELSSRRICKATAHVGGFIGVKLGPAMAHPGGILGSSPLPPPKCVENKNNKTS